MYFYGGRPRRAKTVEVGGDFILRLVGDERRIVEEKVPSAGVASTTLRRSIREEVRVWQQLGDSPAAHSLIAGWVDTYNRVRFYSALGYLPPLVYYRGNCEACFSERRKKLQATRSRRQDAWDAHNAAARPVA